MRTVNEGLYIHQRIGMPKKEDVLPISRNKRCTSMKEGVSSITKSAPLKILERDGLSMNISNICSLHTSISCISGFPVVTNILYTTYANEDVKRVEYHIQLLY